MEAALKVSGQAGFLDSSEKIPFATLDLYRVLKTEGNEFLILDHCPAGIHLAPKAPADSCLGRVLWVARVAPPDAHSLKGLTAMGTTGATDNSALKGAYVQSIASHERQWQSLMLIWGLFKQRITEVATFMTGENNGIRVADIDAFKIDRLRPAKWYGPPLPSKDWVAGLCRS